MTDKELEALLDDLESDGIERKESAIDGDRIRQAICAFANDLPDHHKPGVLFIGVDDKGNPIGTSVTDQLLTTLSDCRSDGNILPFPSMTVEKRRLKGHDVAVVIVQPADAPPVRFKGVTWIRVGPRRATATPQEERQLAEKRRFRDLPFDVRPATGLPMGTLDDLLFSSVYLPAAVSADVLLQNERSVEQQLMSLRFAHPGPPVCPTTLGLLVLGRNPVDYLPGAYIQFLRLDGKTLTDPIKSSKSLSGPLPRLLADLDDLLKMQISTASDITTQPVEARTPDYPIVALQQLARNAVMHRTYEITNAPVRITWFADRVEIQNPGGPFGQVNRRNFGNPGVSDYRNPHLAEAMKTLGYVQRFGVGIALARQEMAKNGNPALDFLVEDSHVAVILRRRQ